MEVAKEWSQFTTVIQFETIRHRKFKLWWRLPSGLPITPSLGDPLIASLLPICMASGEQLRIDKPVSPMILEHIHQIQSIYSPWMPDWHRVSIEAPQQSAIENPGERIGSFFSGGVDSFYTLLKNPILKSNDSEYISDLLFVAGFDIPLRKKAVLKKARTSIQEIAAAAGRRYLEVRTNIRKLSDPFVSWDMYHGAAMASVGLLCGSIFKKLYIPSSFSNNQLHPWGSHPELNPLWSTETLKFIDDDCNPSRLEKTVLISQSDLAIKHLRVCWKNYYNKYNCGVCEKCIRTMIALHIGSGAVSFPTFPKPLTMNAVRKLKLNSETALTFARENYECIPCDNDFDRHLHETLGEVIQKSSNRISYNK